ncbi:MAG: response regulator transcription factor [Gammaproteobacteria bacterium]
MMNTNTRRAKRQILIVDADPLVRRGMIDILRHTGDLSVTAAVADGATAIAALADDSPDLVITELALEHSADGLELVQHIRTRYPGLPVIVLSGHQSVEHASAALEAGASAFIDKREAIDRVLITIQRVLQQGAHLTCRPDDRSVH